MIYKQLGALAVGTFAILGLLLFAFRSSVAFESTVLLAVLVIVFQSAFPFIVAYFSSSSYLKTGLRQLVLLGCAMVAFGIFNIIVAVGILFVNTPEWANFIVTIHNSGLFVLALLTFFGSILAFVSSKYSSFNHKGRKSLTVYTYLTVGILGLLFALLTLFNVIPPFVVSGDFTLLRQVVLFSTVGLLIIASLIFGKMYLESKSNLVYWYSLGLALIAIGVIGILVEPSLGTPLSWLGRIAQYGGDVFLLAAVLSKVSSSNTAEAMSEGFKRDKYHFNLLFAHMRDGFAYHRVILDDKGKPVDYVFLEMNEAFEKITGLRSELIVGKRATEVLPGIEKSSFDWIGTYGRVAVTKEPVKFTSFLEPLQKWFAVSAFSPTKNYFAITIEDITDRKKAEEALKENEQLYRTVFDNSQDGFQLIQLIYDENGRPIDHKFLKVNHAYEKIIGVKAEDILDKTARYISPNDEPHWLETPDRVLKTGISEHVELYNQDINKTLDCFYFRYSENVVGTLFRDVTERKKLEKQLQDSERLAAIGATAGMVGHDIRNPLQAITGDVFLAKSELDGLPDSEEKKAILESLEETGRNIEYINKIVQDLQDYARPLNPNPGEADLKLIIDRLLEKNGLPQNVKVRVKIEDEAKRLIADSDYLNRILYNLVTNAVQAMPNGGKLSITVNKEANDIVVAVKDTGVGIPKEIQSKMFTPMFTTKSKGQGFGLPVVKRMTEALGGTVTFESQEGKGTTFTIRLPVKSQ